MPQRSILILSLLSATALAGALPAPKPSYYGTRILRALKDWPPAEITRVTSDRPVAILAIRTPGHPEIIGLIKHFTVAFPIEKVAAVEESFETYPRIWKDLESVRVEARDGNRVLTDWVRSAPAFFLPKIRYRILYTIDRSTPDRIVYRQQLVDGNSVKSTDALVVLDKLGDGSTRVSVLDFFNADFGPFRSLIEGSIWRKSVENSFKDDIAFKSRLEHPDWSADRLDDAARQALDRSPIREVQYTRLPALAGD